ncbi:hypothetical protein PsorP6_018092 [Peronosclerospora sorghi]|uniref:Uncharacterized protein n=1 Tax=Peronosclerospora sorghi TaxID=230839 RepID=A0ACC0WDC5_9STRA|nr:hypothetical protein PsorP6_018092 [Peronosclerospora sorghi]
MQIILRQLAADVFTNVVWINLRDPFTARRSAWLNENDLVPGITGHKVQILESSLKQQLQRNTSQLPLRRSFRTSKVLVYDLEGTFDK